MTMTDETAPHPPGAEGARHKQQINQQKRHRKSEPFDPGASMLGTDDEAGAPPDPDGMEAARRAPKP